MKSSCRMGTENQDGSRPRDAVGYIVTVLCSPGFLGAVAVLLINDQLLKPAFSNAITGKLSDVAGLVAAGLFVLALFPRRNWLGIGTVAVLFTLWKLPTSSEFISLWDRLLPQSIAITRVVDYSDLLALPILFLASLYIARLRRRIPARQTWVRRTGALAAMMLASFAFIASDHPAPRYVLSPSPAYSVPAPRAAVREALVRSKWALACAACKPSATGDTLTGFLDTHGGPWVAVRVQLTDHNGCGTDVTPLSTQTLAKTPDLDAIRRMFVEQVVTMLRGLPQDITLRCDPT